MGLALHIFLIFLVKVASAATTITTLPGYTGQLPFTLETGYVGVGDDENVQLFYYFVKSQNSPSEDPLLLWITGGPGCSTLRAFFYEHGPLVFDIDNYPYDGSTLPTLLDNPYAWTQYLNIIYLDGPVGTGFSYSKTAEDYNTSDFKFAADINKFLGKWLEAHTEFSTNDIYIGGDGYTGNVVPITLQEIINDNEAGTAEYPVSNIKGYVLGSPGTDFSIDFNSRIPYANRMGYIPDELFKVANTTCNGNFLDLTDEQCAASMDTVNGLIDNINTAFILDPTCKNIDADVVEDAIQQKPKIEINSAERYLKEMPAGLHSSADEQNKWCRENRSVGCRKCNHKVNVVWANDPDVQKALGVEEGTKTTWLSCNETIDSVSYTKDVSSVVDYHQNLTKTSMRGIIYSGDHDMDIPNIGTQQWIWSLDLDLDEIWRVWSVENETAGYMRTFKNGDFGLTYGTIKGAGHFAPEYKPKQSYEMMKRWMANNPL